MQSLLTKLIILLVALIGWVVYSKMDQIKDLLGMAREAAPVLIEAPKAKTKAETTTKASAEAPASTTIYKWQDANGEWHFTSTAPEHATTIETKTYAHDANVVPAIKARKDEGPSLLPGILGGEDDARSGGSRTSGIDPLKALATKSGGGSGSAQRGLQILRQLDHTRDVDNAIESVH